MNHIPADGALPPKTTSAASFSWPGSRSVSTPQPLTLLLLLAAGVAAAVLHESFRLPLRMPGYHGIEWLAILVLARLASSRPAAGMVTGIGAALATCCIGSGGNGQTVMALTFLLQGCLADALLFRPSVRLAYYLWLPLAGAMIHMTAPLMRNAWMMLAAGTLPFGSLTHGIGYPLATHALFGAAGALLGLAIFVCRKP
jgi:hypothetical protein